MTTKRQIMSSERRLQQVQEAFALPAEAEA